MITDKFSADKMVFVYTTCADLKEAKYLSYSAIEEKLAICADFWPVESIYPWQGVVQDVEQYMIIFTTEKSLSEKLAGFISGLHSYSVPMVAECDTAFTNPAYAVWADKVLRSKDDFISPEEINRKQIEADEDGYHPGRLK